MKKEPEEVKDTSMTSENEERSSEKDKDQSMDVDKKPCIENTASTQSITANRTIEEEPERIVKVSSKVNLVLFKIICYFYKILRTLKYKLPLLLL